MAKDKSKKGAAEAPSTSEDDVFAKPSEAPATGDGWKFEDEKNVGELFLIMPLRTEQVADKYSKEGGTKEVVIADIVALDSKKPEKSVEHTGVYIWGGWTKGATRGFIAEPGKRGRLVVARLAQDASKSTSQSPAWVLEDVDADDLAVARAYRASVDPLTAAAAPVAEKAGKKSKKK